MNTTSTLRAWFTIITASLFFFYEFIQMNMFNSISVQLMHAFNINATQLSQMSSYYFIANVIFLFFAGMLLDRYSAKKIILVALAICIAGIVGFASAQSYWTAVLFRFFTGIGSAFCFLSVIRLATRWFHDRQLALVTSAIVAMAMAGGILAQTPLEILTQHLNWRHALFADAGLGVVIFFIIAILVRDYPRGEKHTAEIGFAEVAAIGYWHSLGLAFLKLQNWLGGIYTSLMNLPLSILGGLWGVVYLQDAHGISHIDAGNITIMMFVGTIIGGPIFGWISDKIAIRRWPMLIGAVVSFILMAFVIMLPGLSYVSLLVIFLLIGFATSSQIIGYPAVAESSMPAIVAMSVSVVNITTQGAQAIFQRLFGRLMDLQAQYTHSAKWLYTGQDFHWAMLIFPVGFLLAFLAAFAMKETYAKPNEEHLS